MNARELDVLRAVAENGYHGQRELADLCKCSLGGINNAVKGLLDFGYLDHNMELTESAMTYLQENRPKRAVILAAGFGMRMVPINLENPKALLEVHGEVLIERFIRQLHQVGVHEIYVVVGFLKERFEYLIDQFDVKLIVNPEYVVKNNLHSLVLAGKYLENCYIIPGDIWCGQNPFRNFETYSWYAVSDRRNVDSHIQISKKQELTKVPASQNGNVMIGISYLNCQDGAMVRKRLLAADTDPSMYNAFWEDALYDRGKFMLSGRVLDGDKYVEINTYEQLRELDSRSYQLRSEAIEIIAGALNADPEEIQNISVLKKGMTNRSFLFTCRNKRYIMRIPGEGTDKLINRAEEAEVYAVLGGKNICDSVIYMNPRNGYKITEFLEGARVCDAENETDVSNCMRKLRQLHNLNLSVEHSFNPFAQIEYYESLWNGAPSEYKDYCRTKKDVLSLKNYVDRHVSQRCLTHIDAVPDNFLFVAGENGQEEIRLIDWEYAGMQDPHVDIAMFCIYAMYDREHVEQTIRAYFPEGCDRATRVKIYCYIAICGLLWSNWCEYKRSLGVEFGEYSIRQYRYAKEYFRIAMAEMPELE